MTNNHRSILEPNITLTLVSTNHGFDDFDVIGHHSVKRFTVGHGIRKGMSFNVYLNDGSKRGGIWQGNPERSIALFLHQIDASASATPVPA